MRSTLVLKFILTLVIVTLVGGVFFTSVTAKTNTDAVSCGSDNFCGASLILGEQCPESDPMALTNHHYHSLQKHSARVLPGHELDKDALQLETVTPPRWMTSKIIPFDISQATIQDWLYEFRSKPPDWKLTAWLALKKHSPTFK